MVARRKEVSRQYGILQEKASPTLARGMTLISSKAASIWLTTLHLLEHGSHLPKGDFRGALALRCRMQLQEVPATCGCGESFTTTHAMLCSRRGFPNIHHNEVRELLADWLTGVCSVVAVAPQLAPLSRGVRCSVHQRRTGCPHGRPSKRIGAGPRMCFSTCMYSMLRPSPASNGTLMRCWSTMNKSRRESMGREL